LGDYQMAKVRYEEALESFLGSNRRMPVETIKTSGSSSREQLMVLGRYEFNTT